MIRLTQRKLLYRARETAGPDQAEFNELLRRYGGVDRVEDLTAAGLARLLDYFTVATRFRSRQRPVLTARNRKLIEDAARHLCLTSHVYTADLRGHAGVADLRDLSGRSLIDLLTRWERRGLEVAAFTAARREIMPAQLRLVQLARKRSEIDDAAYYRMLQDYGAVLSAADLDRRGFDTCLAFLEVVGFERAPVTPAAPTFAAGRASPRRSSWN